MNDQITKVLNHLEKLDAEERTRNDVPQEDRMFTLHPDTAQLVHMLIESTQSKNIVEVGLMHCFSSVICFFDIKLQSIKIDQFL